MLAPQIKHNNQQHLAGNLSLKLVMYRPSILNLNILLPLLEYF